MKIVLLAISAAFSTLLALGLLAPTHALAWGDGPEISRSLGKKGGVVVLWPRTPEKTPASVEQLAKVQTALAIVAEGVSGQVDVRPSPERACPRTNGCRAASISALVAEIDGGCALVAMVSAPGKSSATLVPWIGEFRLKQTSVPFRESPESRVAVLDFGICDDFDIALGEGREKLATALRKVLGS